MFSESDPIIPLFTIKFIVLPVHWNIYNIANNGLIRFIITYQS